VNIPLPVPQVVAIKMNKNNSLLRGDPVRQSPVSNEYESDNQHTKRYNLMMFLQRGLCVGRVFLRETRRRQHHGFSCRTLLELVMAAVADVGNVVRAQTRSILQLRECYVPGLSGISTPWRMHPDSHPVDLSPWYLQLTSKQLLRLERVLQPVFWAFLGIALRDNVHRMASGGLRGYVTFLC